MENFFWWGIYQGFRVDIRKIQLNPNIKNLGHKKTNLFILKFNFELFNGVQMRFLKNKLFLNLVELDFEFSSLCMKKNNFIGEFKLRFKIRKKFIVWCKKLK